MFRALQVSVMSKLVPSPDWFVGLDGLNLCENGKFVDSVTVEVLIESLLHFTFTDNVTVYHCINFSLNSITNVKP